MDVYRLEGVEDFLDLGTEEMLYGDGVCVIEWSKKVKQALPKNTIYIDIMVNDDNSRKIIINSKDFREDL